MKVIAALVVAVAALSGWSSAEAVEVHIASFAFSWRDARTRQVHQGQAEVLGRDLKGIVYTNLPAQRQQCLEDVERKIARCRENIDFGSDTKNNDYADCLPIFREQAQLCVGHFERERVKCGGRGVASTGAAGLDSDQRRRLQTALAAAGFDPGPADGQFGARTRQAIQAWQQAKGHIATGELTSAQVEAVAGRCGLLCAVRAELDNRREPALPSVHQGHSFVGAGRDRHLVRRLRGREGVWRRATGLENQ